MVRPSRHRTKKRGTVDTRTSNIALSETRSLQGAMAGIIRSKSRKEKKGADERKGGKSQRGLGVNHLKTEEEFP